MEAGIFLGGFVSNYYHQFYDDQKLTAAERPLLDRVTPQFGARFAYFFGKYIGVEGEASLDIAGVQGRSSSAMLYGLGAQGIVQYPGVLTPFVDFGIELLHISSDDTVLGSDTDFPIHLGVGARWFITENLALRVDGRLLRGPSSKDPYTLDATYGEFNVGISWAPSRHETVVRPPPPDPDPDHDGVLGDADKCPHEPTSTPDGCPVRDRDHDGIPDDKDSCPDEPETVNGYKDEDGCPDTIPDTDGDGINDLKDKCPTEPEDKDGFQDEDGCPDPDNDGDGVVDTADRCPMEKGQVENHGCPDVDSDGDGIVDRLDNCPNEKGSPANQGCKAKQLVVITQTQLKILDQVHFQTGTAKLAPTSRKLLDNIAAIMSSHPDIKAIKVEGFTDNVGKRDMNQTLSEARAKSVRDYLVAKGIAGERLLATGHGEDGAIGDNKTAKGREQNRRVEFNIVND